MRIIKSQKGYTITELLIVVAITGTLFTITMAMVKGQADKFAYQDSMRQLQQLAQQAIKDTENGYFPPSTSVAPCTRTSSAVPQGTDGACVFVGKRVTFCGGTTLDDGAGNANSGCANRAQMRVQNMQNWAPGPSGVAVKNVGPDVIINIPGNLTYLGSYYADDGSDRQSGSTGYMTRFALLAGNGSGSGCSDNVFCAGITGVQQTIDIANYWGNDLTRARAVCFDGYKNGSLVFGIAGSTNITLNLDDPNCYGTF